MAEKFGKTPDRRQFLAETMRYAALGVFGAIGGITLAKRHRLVKEGLCPEDGPCSGCDQFTKCYRPQVWQINAYKCVACGNCATHCVLEESAVKLGRDGNMVGACIKWIWSKKRDG